MPTLYSGFRRGRFNVLFSPYKPTPNQNPAQSGKKGVFKNTGKVVFISMMLFVWKRILLLENVHSFFNA